MKTLASVIYNIILLTFFVSIFMTTNPDILDNSFYYACIVSILCGAIKDSKND